MPKSKREKVVSLTQTDKKGREGKEALYRSIRDALDTCKYAWVFSVENMRNTYLKDVRAQWADSRIFLGRTKVMAKALGNTPAEEYLDGLSRLSPLLKGTVGLLCTSHPPELVEEWFASYSKTDFARAGTTSPLTFTVPAGAVYTRGGQVAAEDDVLLSHTLEPSVRGMGMPTLLKNGVITLSHDYTVCKEGDLLNSNQTRLLKLFGIAVAQFEIKLLGHYDADRKDVVIRKA
ncbi:ribosomal protein L10-domain-containing protein [Protomyces lactucae-debilis]|uniref:Ribosome assembly factor mrt4 n=1 Tax=Protomyces lactucae-debilis TaxID=2754530 RepID=A0A1Y2FSL6_PROLT|nr:ribosomal protein L10-domain-containing protein [Protomyces lactucae-debilis]ORY86304.1 ribosomal protein L10-domain-containing protein [Protomyces lactucae-debilis]